MALHLHRMRCRLPRRMSPGPELIRRRAIRPKDQASQGPRNKGYAGRMELKTDVSHLETVITEPLKRVESSVARFSDFGALTRYEFRHVLGVGGMGEVQAVRDNLLRRDIALKTIREAEQ